MVLSVVLVVVMEHGIVNHKMVMQLQLEQHGGDGRSSNHLDPSNDVSYAVIYWWVLSFIMVQCWMYQVVPMIIGS